MPKSKILIFFIVTLAALLRFYQLGTNPPALYWDEASLGYNAFAILKSGIDEHGKSFPITNFAAFGDYKPPLYIYLSTVPIAIFGLSEFSIRFASALFGTATVLATYYLAKKLFENEKISLVAAFLFAISPWHIQLSRAAFEGNVALFFSTVGILFFFKFALDSPKLIFVSLASFLAAMYTFTGQRLFVPIIGPLLAIQFWPKILAHTKIFIFGLVLSAFIFYPLYNFSAKTIEGKLRFEEVTIFKDLDPISESAHLREADGNSIVSRFIHNRRFLFAREYLKNYFDAFDPGFLFAHGDGNPRLSVRDVGELYYFELPLLVTGIFFLIKNKQKYRYFIFAWLLVSPLGPATARETPHALRMVHVLPTFQLISAYGFFSLSQNIRYKTLLFSTLSLLIFVSVFYYLHQYYFHYPKSYSGEWQYGYKQVVEEAQKYHDKVNRIVVTEKLGRPYIYFLLYNQTLPTNYLNTAKIVKDNFFFYHVDSFDKYVFTDEFDTFASEEKILYITQHGKMPISVPVIKTIYDKGNFAVFDIGIK